METDDAGKSLFAAVHSLEVPPPPEPPRLGISHLLILTACVAAYMGVDRTLTAAYLDADFQVTAGAFDTATATVWGIGGGAALAGIVLFVARRFRRLPFPVHPGEYLLVLVGFAVACRCARTAAVLLHLHLEQDGNYHLSSSYFAWHYALLAVYALIFLWVVVRVRIPRWRLFFLTMPASYLVCRVPLHGLLRLLGPSMYLGVLADAGAKLPVAVVLAVVVLKDHLDGRRYPWTHWFGVGTRFWLDAVTVVAAAWSVLWPT
jgi:hypothetical protein